MGLDKPILQVAGFLLFADLRLGNCRISVNCGLILALLLAKLYFAVFFNITLKGTQHALSHLAFPHLHLM